jgi:glycerophosphoryl diester phosphodiesterase
MNDRSLRLVAGPKGAYGNTIESFHEALQAGADTVEIDVIWLPDAHLPREQRAPLIVAHDWEDAARRTPLRLTEALDALLEPPLDRLEVDVDIKLPGREEELVDALRERGMVERTMISTLELYSIGRVRELEPSLRRGWSYPKVSKDWPSIPWVRPALPAALKVMRYRLPAGNVGLPPAGEPPAGPDLRPRRGGADRLEGGSGGANEDPARGRRHRDLLERAAAVRTIGELTWP